MQCSQIKLQRIWWVHFARLFAKGEQKGKKNVNKLHRRAAK